MSYYVLSLAEHAGMNEYHTNHVVEAEDKQMVKYHYHRTLKQMGYTDTIHHKHCLEGHDQSLTEIDTIKEISKGEYKLLSEHIPNWIKV
jgi:hypothetical protein